MLLNVAVCFNSDFLWLQRYQQGIRDRAATRIDGGEIIRVEAHPMLGVASWSDMLPED